ncbi:MAG: O-antigen ligase family protein [Rhodoferax sp.]|nr:O-antigen ligase family protein [Rhodoferax sp.]
MRLLEHLPTVILVVPNDVLMLAVCLPFLLVMLVAVRRGWQTVGIALAAITCLAAMVALNSRAALVASFLGSLVVLFIVGSRRWWHALALAAAAIIVADGVRGFTLLSKFAQHSLACEPRLPLWGAAFRLWLERPFFGQGAHNFAGLYRAHIDALGLPECALKDTRLTPWPHNLFLEVLSSQGLFGGLFLLTLLVWVGLRLHKLMHVDSPPMRLQAAGLLAAWVTFGFAATVELTFFRYWVIVMFITLLGLTVALKLTDDHL